MAEPTGAEQQAGAEKEKPIQVRFDKLREETQKLLYASTLSDATDTQKMQTSLMTAFRNDLTELETALAASKDESAPKKLQEVQEIMRLVQGDNMETALQAVSTAPPNNALAKSIAELPEFQNLQKSLTNIDSLTAAAHSFADKMDAEVFKEHQEASGQLENDMFSKTKDKFKNTLKKFTEGPFGALILMMIEGMLSMDGIGNFLFQIVGDQMADKWSKQIQETINEECKPAVLLLDKGTPGEIKSLYKIYRSKKSEQSFPDWFLAEYVTGSPAFVKIKDHIKSKTIPINITLDEIVKLKQLKAEEVIGLETAKNPTEVKAVMNKAKDLGADKEKRNKSFLVGKLQKEPLLFVRSFTDQPRLLKELQGANADFGLTDANLIAAQGEIANEYELNATGTPALSIKGVELQFSIKGSAIDISLVVPGKEKVEHTELKGIDPNNLKDVLKMMNHLGEPGEAVQTLEEIKKPANDTKYAYKKNQNFWDKYGTTIGTVQTAMKDALEALGGGLAAAIEGLEKIPLNELMPMAARGDFTKGEGKKLKGLANGKSDLELQKSVQEAICKRLGIDVASTIFTSIESIQISPDKLNPEYKACSIVYAIDGKNKGNWIINSSKNSSTSDAKPVEEGNLSEELKKYLQ